MVPEGSCNMYGWQVDLLNVWNDLHTWFDWQYNIMSYRLLWVYRQFHQFKWKKKGKNIQLTIFHDLSVATVRTELTFHIIRAGVGSVVTCDATCCQKTPGLRHGGYTPPSWFSFRPLWAGDALITLPPTHSAGVGWLNQLHTTALILQIYPEPLTQSLDHNYFSLFLNPQILPLP